jgi:DNA-directed RNA polymerase specialized sigma24 family protein
MDRPVGYLFRVGQSASRRWQWRRPRWHEPVPPPAGGEPWVEPGLPKALAALTQHQRVAVVLCHGFEWTHREVADLLGVSPSTVQNHVERGLTKLRRDLEVNHGDGRSAPA